MTIEPDVSQWNDLPPDVRREIERLIPAGRKIDAIKLFRRFTDAGLREAKEAVENWGDVQRYEDLPEDTRALIDKLVPGIDRARKVIVHRSTMGASSGKPALDWKDLPPEARTEIERLLPEGRFIDAIRVYRRHSSAALKTAKDTVYSIASGMGIQPPKGLVPGISCLLMLAGLVVWAGMIAAMPFLSKYLLLKIFGDRISLQLLETLQALSAIGAVFVSIFAVVVWVVRRSGQR